MTGDRLIEILQHVQLFERLMILVIVEIRTKKHSLRSQVGIGSESNCLLGQQERILDISDLAAGLKFKSTDEAGGEDKCAETGAELLTREKRSLDILSVKKKAKLSACELAEVKVGKYEEDHVNQLTLRFANFMITQIKTVELDIFKDFPHMS